MTLQLFTCNIDVNFVSSYSSICFQHIKTCFCIFTALIVSLIQLMIFNDKLVLNVCYLHYNDCILFLNSLRINPDSDYMDL